MALIDLFDFCSEINALRRELKLLKQSQKDKELVFITRRHVNTSPAELGARKASGKVSRAGTAGTREETRMIEMQREEIKRLRKRMNELENSLAASQKRPISQQQRLPALDADGSVV